MATIGNGTARTVHRGMLRTAAAGLALLVPSSLAAQAQKQLPRTSAAVAEGRVELASPRHAGAQAAGTRALHLCTGYFASGAPRDLIDATIGTVGHPLPPATARTQVDEQEKRVSVFFDEALPPRIAVARPIIGCTLLPIGATAAFAATLPRPSGTAPTLDERSWPAGDRNATARLPGRRAAAVGRLIDEAFKDEAGRYSGVSWGVLVIKAGKIVAERYQYGFDRHAPARTNSMCKSLSATLVGVGVRKGLLDLHAKAPLTEWRRPGDPRGEITLDHLLRMTSGLYTERAGDRQNELYLSGAPVSEVAAMNVVDSAPGTRFVYAGADTLLAMRALREAVHDDGDFPTFPHRELLWKIGMTRTILEMDPNGDFLSSGQCWSTARDFGRLGLLYLSDGTWAGERLLPPGWARYVSTPGPAQPERGQRYGAQFWLFGGVDGLPADAFSALGARGQYAVIIPSKDMVIVRRGFDGPRRFEITRFAADIVRALED